ncbi:hypothetical protein BGZ94_006509 [Podila epigama]|nr:hypothetical protein BGZ94_006509 [Podila epigama]
MHFVILGAHRLLRSRMEKGALIMDWVVQAMNLIMVIILFFEFWLQRQQQKQQQQEQEQELSSTRDTMAQLSPRVIYYQPHISQFFERRQSQDQQGQGQGQMHPDGHHLISEPTEELPKYEAVDEQGGMMRGVAGSGGRGGANGESSSHIVIVDMTNVRSTRSNRELLTYEAALLTTGMNSTGHDSHSVAAVASEQVAGQTIGTSQRSLQV